MLTLSGKSCNYMKMLVLMQADYPVGIYTTEDAARLASRAHYERWYKLTYPRKQIEDFYYRTYKFEVDGPAGRQ